MKKKLDKIETRLRTLFEQHLPHLITGGDPQLDLVYNLIHVIRENLIESAEGLIYAPDQFALILHPDQIPTWENHQELLDEIASAIQRIGLEENFVFRQPISISIRSDPDMPDNTLSVRAERTKPDPSLPDTAAMTQTKLEIEPQGLPENAFLVLGGKMNTPLEKPVINIGRHSDNDIVLDDPHISRHHAQLRSINQRFVIFDVGSYGGLLLNGKKITKATLHAGDVIRLGVTSLIYIQDSTGETPTTALPVDSEDHPSKGPEK